MNHEELFQIHEKGPRPLFLMECWTRGTNVKRVEGKMC